MNKGTNSANRSRDIVTPAMRNAEREKKLLSEKRAAEQRVLAEKAAAENSKRAEDAKKAQIQAMRRSSVVSPAERNTGIRKPSAGTSVNSAVTRAAGGSGAATVRNSGVPPKGTAVSGKAGYVSSGRAPSASANPGYSPSGHISSAPATPGGATVGRGTAAPSKPVMTAEQQRILAEKQREIEIMERRLRAEQEKKAAETARVRRITELQYRIEKEKITREELILKDRKKDNPENQRIHSLIAVCVIAVLIILNIVVFAQITQKDIPSRNTAPVTDGDTSDTGNQQSGDSGITGIQDNTDKFTVTSSDYVNGTLILVNSEYAYDFDNTGTDIRDDELITVATNIQNKTFKASNYKIYLNRETMDMLNAMMADFYAYCSKTDVMVNTAHRTFEEQQDILKTKKEQLGEDQKIAQTPGNSEHHTGYAFDFAIYPANENGSNFINVGDYTWIYENCHKYGFILRYPDGKSAITGIDPESWHFRYVGVPHATYMYNKNKTLEEYITDISIYSEGIPLTVNVSETESYNVFYVKKSDGGKTNFSVPKNTEYKISGDNVGGFIVWYNNADVGNKGKINPAPEITEDSGNEVQGESGEVGDNASAESGTADE